MQKIPLVLAQPGMKLAKAVARANGMPIVAAGVELTEALIARLEGLNVGRIFVVGDAVAASENPSERAARLDHLFRRLEDDPFMRKVKAYLREYFTIKAAANRSSAKAKAAAGKAGKK